MRVIIASVFLLLSVFLLIFATRFDFEIEQNNRENSEHSKREWKLDDEPKNLFSFLQISDIHISKFKDPKRIEDFRTFCSEVNSVIRPKIIIISGDLTDAKSKLLGSQQYVEEWTAYRKVLEETEVLNKTFDVRGNHDNFNVPFLYSSEDLFRNFSAQGTLHKRSYLHQIEFEEIKYNFMALDASTEPGMRRPYNFIGLMDSDEIARVETMMNEKPANITVWFAHYPTSTIMISSGIDLRKFIGKFKSSSVFVAGHLHTLGNLVYHMYTLQPEGFLELELGDFMKHRLFRLSVFDHGLFSFVDVRLGTWPLAIITNPKNILFNNPFKEDSNLQSKSTHIRILAFSTAFVRSCKIRINGGEWFNCERKTETFFVAPWEPSLYKHGKHKIEVFVDDANGKTFSQEQFFAIDGTRGNFDFLAKFVLMSDITIIFQTAFLGAFFFCLTSMLFFKSWQLLIKYGKLRPPKVTRCRNIIQRYLVFASIDRVFFLILIFLLYTAFCPWSFHEVLDGQTGYYFVWGVYVQGIFVPGTLSWLYGFYQIMFFQIPITVIIANVLHKRFLHYLVTYHKPSISRPKDTTCKFIYFNLPFFALLAVEILLAVFYSIQNGIFFLVIAPIRFWGIALFIFLFYQAHFKISDAGFKQTAIIYSPELKLSTS